MKINPMATLLSGPFDTIHPEMCGTLIARIQEKRQLKRHHIYLLVNPASFFFGNYFLGLWA
jgi:hypothetical protein